MTGIDDVFSDPSTHNGSREVTSMETHVRNADFVWTWVDGSDPEWVTKYQTHVPGGKTNMTKVRFYACDELYYSLELCYKHTSDWHRGRYLLVTDAQHPDLDRLSPSVRERVRIVDHTEFIPREYLPTFNSTVIEYFLPRIPDLTEYFVSFNDDFMIWNPLPLSYFWDGEMLQGYVDWFETCYTMQTFLNDNGTTLAHTCDIMSELLPNPDPDRRYAHHGKKHYGIPTHAPRIWSTSLLRKLHHIAPAPVIESLDLKIRKRWKTISTVFLFENWHERTGHKRLVSIRNTDFYHFYANFESPLFGLYHWLWNEGAVVYCINNATCENPRDRKKIRTLLQARLEGRPYPHPLWKQTVFVLLVLCLLWIVVWIGRTF